MLGAGHRIALVGAMLMLVGCGPATPSPSAPQATSAPDFVRPFSDGAGRVLRLLVDDAAGMLIDIQQQAGGEAIDANIRWDPIPGSPDSLLLSWIGGVCTTDRSLTVSRQGSQVSLALFEGHNRPLASREACPAIGILYQVKLTFRQPIASLEISAALSELPQ